jgi:hypothetical protein
MKHYKMILKCGCEEMWWEADTFPGVGGIAECTGNDLENCDETGLPRGETHQMQEITEAWEEDD